MLGFRVLKEDAGKEQTAQQKSAKQREVPQPTVGILGSGGAERAADAIRKRKAQIDAAAGYANGGKVVGPGTGTSDDIETVVPEGSYIMPADSTQTIGEETLSSLGRGVPVALSNGEFQLPPEQVHDIGAQVLDQLRNATHTPVARGFDPDAAPSRDDTPAPGEEPKLFFADGGVVEDEDRLRVQTSPNAAAMTGGRMMPRSGAPVLSDSPRGSFGAQTRMSADRRAEIAQAREAERQRRIANISRIGGLAGGSAAMAQSRLLSEAQQSSEPASPPPTPAPPAAPAASQAAASEVVAPPSPQATSAAAPSLPAAPQATEVLPGIFRSGNSYSDSADGAIAGAAPAQPMTPQNARALDNLTQRQQLEQAGRLALSQSAPRGFDINVPRAPRSMGSAARTAFGFSTPEERERRALVRALSTPHRGAQNGQLTANQMRGLLDLRNSEAQGVRADNQNQTALMQEAMRGQTSLANNSLSQGNENLRAAARNAIDAQNADTAAQRTNVDVQARGFDIRQAERMEQLRQQYEAAETPEARASVAQRIRELSGVAQPSGRDRYIALGGGQEFDAASGVMRNVPQQLFDTQTGQYVTPGAGAAALPPIDQNPQAIAIAADTSLSRAERAERLRALGYN